MVDVDSLSPTSKIRYVRQFGVNELIESFKQKNWIGSSVTVCISEINSTLYRIIDGAHRVQAIQQLKKR